MLLQDSSLVINASRVLTQMEINFAQEKKKSLQLIFDVISFITVFWKRYLLKIPVESDHPLQRMLIELQIYDVKLNYKPVIHSRLFE